DPVVGDALTEGGGDDVVVDTPARVVVEGLAAVGPPAVGAVDLARPAAPDVDPAEAGALGAVDADDGLTARSEEAVEVGAFAGQEAGSLHVALPVLDVELAVPHIEVAHDGDVLALVGEFV